MQLNCSVVGRQKKVLVFFKNVLVFFQNVLVFWKNLKRQLLVVFSRIKKTPKKREKKYGLPQQSKKNKFKSDICYAKILLHKSSKLTTFA